MMSWTSTPPRSTPYSSEGGGRGREREGGREGRRHTHRMLLCRRPFLHVACMYVCIELLLDIYIIYTCYQ